MARLHCKRCSKEVHPGRGDYYLVSIDAVADPQPPIITQEDLDQDVGAEIERLIRRMKSMSEQQLERQVFRSRRSTCACGASMVGLRTQSAYEARHSLALTSR
jgi:hypothetical protein